MFVWMHKYYKVKIVFKSFQTDQFLISFWILLSFYFSQLSLLLLYPHQQTHQGIIQCFILLRQFLFVLSFKPKYYLDLKFLYLIQLVLKLLPRFFLLQFYFLPLQLYHHLFLNHQYQNQITKYQHQQSTLCKHNYQKLEVWTLQY